MKKSFPDGNDGVQKIRFPVWHRLPSVRMLWPPGALHIGGVTTWLSSQAKGTVQRQIESVGHT